MTIWQTKNCRYLDNLSWYADLIEGYHSSPYSLSFKGPGMDSDGNSCGASPFFRDESVYIIEKSPEIPLNPPKIPWNPQDLPVAPLFRPLRPNRFHLQHFEAVRRHAGWGLAHGSFNSNCHPWRLDDGWYPHDLGELQICVGHFGSSNVWMKHVRNDDVILTSWNPNQIRMLMNMLKQCILYPNNRWMYGI